VTVRLGNAQQFIERFGRRVSAGEYADDDNRIEGSRRKRQGLTKRTFVQGGIAALVSCLAQHAWGKIESFKVAVAALGEQLARKPGPATGVENARLGAHVTRKSFDDLQRPGVVAHVGFIGRRPLVVAGGHFDVVPSGKNVVHFCGHVTLPSRPSKV
jgi:hypothetical protein